jgi:Bacterial regulatory proteins, luxR family
MPGAGPRTGPSTHCPRPQPLTGAHNTRVSLAALIAVKPGCRPRLIYRIHRIATNAQIAAQLYISIRTVSSHLERILWRLKIGSYACELCLLGFQAARTYSLIRPLRTGFRRI